MSRKELLNLFILFTIQDRRIGGFIAVDVQNEQDSAITHWIEKLNTLPSSFEWSCFGLAIADNSDNEQVRIIEGSSEGMGEYVA